MEPPQMGRDAVTRSTLADKVAGVVLAGGKSSRMGENKALMAFKGRPLVEHMTALLRQAGCADVYISGDVPGYAGIPDAVRHDGPARAIIDLLGHFAGAHERLLFVPVDMPLIQVNSLTRLIEQNDNTYFKGFPLPCCLRTGVLPPSSSVRAVLESVQARMLDLSREGEPGMANINTKQEWEALAS